MIDPRTEDAIKWLIDNPTATITEAAYKFFTKPSAVYYALKRPGSQITADELNRRRQEALDAINEKLANSKEALRRLNHLVVQPDCTKDAAVKAWFAYMALRFPI